MPRTLMRALAVVLTLAGAPAGASEIPDEPSEAAMTFVGGFSDDHLSGMLSRVGARQETLVALSQLNGEVLAAVFDAEIDKAVVKYGPEWQRNMARAWTPLMTDTELLSLATAGAQSPHTEKYLGLRAEAGQSMQALSEDLFRQILEEVIRNTLTELQPEPQQN